MIFGYFCCFRRLKLYSILVIEDILVTDKVYRNSKEKYLIKIM